MIGNKTVQINPIYVKHLGKEIYIVEPDSLDDIYNSLYYDQERVFLNQYFDKIEYASELFKGILPDTNIYNKYVIRKDSKNDELRDYFSFFEKWFNNLMKLANSQRTKKINYYINLWNYNKSQETNQEKRELMEQDIRMMKKLLGQGNNKV